MISGAKFGRRGRRTKLALAVATALAAGASVVRADNAGVDNLMAGYPVLDFTGQGLNVAQVEADTNGLNSYEANPSVTNQPAALFTYIDETGGVSSTYSSADGSEHADTVGRNFYGGNGEGVAPGVAHVDNYDADYFVFNMVAPMSGPQLPTLNNDKIISESFVIEQPGLAGLSDQLYYDTQYDLYEINFPSTILVSAVGYSDPSTGVNQPFSPGTSYNGIAVNADAPGGNQASGPTLDGRDKPDIEAPPQTGGEYTSYATPRVAGAAAILVEAGTRGDADATSTVSAFTVQTAAVDPRVVKALLMNGATKAAGWSTGTSPTNPLNPVSGAGDLNVYTAYLNFRAGEQLESFSTSQASNVATPATSEPGGYTAINGEGWSFTSIPTTNTTSEVEHYRINGDTTGSTTLTATLDWWRNPTLPNYTAANPINNLYLYLYDATTQSFVNDSISTLNNVQEIYATVNGSDDFDLMVMKQGGALGTTGVVSASETYALAWNLAENGSTLVTNWENTGSGSWQAASDWKNDTIPNAAGAQAQLTSALQNNAVVTLGGNVTVGSLEFYSVPTYNVTSGTGGTLTLDNAGIPSVITVHNSNHTISAPVMLTTFGATTDILAGASLTFAGNVSGDGSITNTGGGTLVLSASNSYTGQTVNGAGSTINANVAGAIPVASGVFNYGNLNINATGTIGAISGTGTVTVPSAVSLSASNFGQNIVVNNGAIAATGTGTVGNITGTGSLTIASGARLTIAPNGSTVAVQNSLTLQGSGSSMGTLDITNNAIVINYGGNSGSYNSSIETTIRKEIINGFDGGAWDGNGITSSVAQADAANPGSSPYQGNAAIGYADNNFLGSTSIPTNSVLIRLTVYGDADLNGIVNLDDFSDWLAGFEDPKDNPDNWVDGDFLYEGSANLDDFSLWLNAFGGPPEPLMHDIEVSTLSDAQKQELINMVNSVPEPVSISLLGICALALLPRRPRRMTSH